MNQSILRLLLVLIFIVLSKPCKFRIQSLYEGNLKTLLFYGDKSRAEFVRNKFLQQVAVLPAAFLGAGAIYACDISDLNSASAFYIASPAIEVNSIFINGCISGAVINAAKNAILHPLETAKARLDTGLRTNIFDDAYSGIVPALVGGVPAAAIFFGTKDILTYIFRAYEVDVNLATIAAVTLAQIPYWLLRNPSEVLKTRIRTGADKSTFLEVLFRKNGINDLYSGLVPNLLYALPSDWLKFISYHYISIILFSFKEGVPMSGGAALISGSLASLVAETLCTPIDVIRTKVMCIDNNNCNVDDEWPGLDRSITTDSDVLEQQSEGSVRTDKNSIKQMFDVIKGSSLTEIYAGAGPRSARALLDGGVQFVCYELTQNFLHGNL